MKAVHLNLSNRREESIKNRTEYQNAYLIEFAVLNGFAKREFFRLKLFLRLNDMRLKNWRKSKFRTVSMVDGLEEQLRIVTNRIGQTNHESIIFEK